MLQLWSAETGTLCAQVGAHAESATVGTLALRGSLLLSGGSDGALAVHSTRVIASRAREAKAALAPLLGATDSATAEVGGAIVMPSIGALTTAATTATASCPCLCHVEGVHGAVTCVELHGPWIVSGAADGVVSVRLVGRRSRA